MKTTPSKSLASLLYGLSFVVSISVWLIALRAPLWLDETISYCQIHSGISEIWSRAGLSFPAYSYILWFFTKILGTSEVALRIPSVLAMLGAVYLLYRAARELFDRDTAMVAAVVFCVHPIVIFEAIDARPYAFVALATNAAIYVLVRLRRDDSTWTAACFGAIAAVIVWFHFLAGVIVPALLIGFLLVKLGGLQPATKTGYPPDAPRVQTAIWRQLGATLVGFAFALLPVIPGLLYMLRTRGNHPFDDAPRFIDLAWTLAPAWFLLVIGGDAFIALIVAGLTFTKTESSKVIQGWQVLLSLALALMPLVILFAVSRQTSLHIFVYRYRLVAIPGIALCWALVVNALKPKILGPMFYIALVAITALQYFGSPLSRYHGYTWKYALQVAEANASVDGAPVLICSDLPESDHIAMPLDSAKDSNYFAPLSYNKLTVPVVPLPRSLNDEATRVASYFLQDAIAHRRRFLALAYRPSYPTLDWLAKSVPGDYSVQKLGEFDEVRVMEFAPLAK